MSMLAHTNKETSVTRFEYTRLTEPDSSLVEGVYYNENNNAVALDLNDDVYVYRGVSREQHDALVGADSVGAYYNTYFKKQFGPAEYLGSYWAVELDIIEVEPKTEKNLTYAPNAKVTTVDNDGSGDLAPTTEHSLGNSTLTVQDAPTNEHSLAPLSEQAREADVDWKTEVFFTIDGFHREYTFDADTSDAAEAVQALSDHLSAFGASGKVRRVVISFE